MDAPDPRRAATPPSSRPSERTPRAPPPIPDYELLKCIGVGSYGEVWLGRSVMGTWRAVKVVSRGHFDDDRPFEREFAGIQKFEPISRLHDSQVDILHVGKNDAEGYFYYVMELADPTEGQWRKGEKGAEENRPLSPSLAFSPASYAPRTLRSELQRQGHLPLEECLNIALTLTAALEYLHAHGLVHRDVKPSNIIFVGGQVKLADIGLVTGVDATRSFVGTEGYIPPEGPGTAQADLFSLGRTLYEISTGKHREDFPEPPTQWQSNPEGASWREFHEVVLKACEPDTKRRYQSAHQMRADLALLQAGKSVKRLRVIERRLNLATKVTVVAGAVALLALAAFVGSLRQSHRADRTAKQEMLQRQLAERNAAEEARQRHRAEEALNQVELERAQEMFNTDNAPMALAHLARVLRQDPSNYIAAERLLSALMHRNFALPAVPAFQHGAGVVSARFSPDNKWVVTASRDGTARVWDAASGEPLANPLKHYGVVAYAEFSPEGQYVVTASEDWTARVWNARTGEPLHDPWRHNSYLNSARFSPDGKLVVTASADRNALVWDVVSGRQVCKLGKSTTHAEAVRNAEFSPDSQRVVTSSDDGAARVWDAHSGEPITDPLRPGSRVIDARFSPDGERVIVASERDGARVWKVRSGDAVGHFESRQRSEVLSVCFAPDGRQAVSTHLDGTVHLWDSDTDLPLTDPLRHKGRVEYGEFSDDGLQLLTASTGGMARVWDTRTGASLTEPLTHNAAIARAAHNANGQQVVTASMDNTAQVWDVKPRGQLAGELRHRDWVHAASFSANGQFILTMSWDNTARIWDASTHLPVTGPLQHEGYVSDSGFSPDGQRVITASRDKTASIWDTRTGRRLIPPLQHNDGVTYAEFSPDGHRVLTACKDGIARVWAADTGRLLALSTKHNAGITEAKFSPDGQTFATGGLDSTCGLWNTHTGREVIPQLRHDAWVNSIRFSPDGRYLASGSGDKTARIWDVRTGKLRTPPLQHGDNVLVVRFNCDGSRLATASADNTARIWDPTTGEPLTAPLKHNQTVNTLEFSPDGRRLVTGSVDKNVRLWDVHTGQPLSERIQLNGTVNSACFSPDGRWLLTATYGKAQIWEVPVLSGPVPEWFPRLAEGIGRQRINAQGQPEIAPSREWIQLRQHILESAATDDFTHWAKWFLGDRGERTISPHSVVTVSEYVQRRIAENTLASLHEALRLSQTNGRLFAQLAMRTLAQKPNEDSRLMIDADWYSQRAVALAPLDSQAWWCRGRVLDRAGKISEALAAMDRAGRQAPSDPEFWLNKGEVLEKVNRLQEACDAYDRAVELSEADTSSETLPNVLLERSRFLRNHGHIKEAGADNIRALNIPQRDPAAGSNLIDLSLHYNYSLTTNSVFDINGNNLASLPTGRQLFLGTEFDVRGVILLADGRRLIYGAPNQAAGIQMGITCRRLHFLHGTHGFVQEGIHVGSYVVHYVDGQEQEIRLKYGEDFRDWWMWNRAEPKQAGNAEVAWTGSNTASPSANSIRIFKITWENPMPTSQIATIHFLSTGTGCAPFLIAITAE